MADLVPSSAVRTSGVSSGLLNLGALRGVVGQPALRRALPAIGSVSALMIAGAAWYSFQSAPQRAIFEGLGDADKGAIADALQSAGISHSIDRSTGAVTVADDDFHKARMMLAARGLPKAAPSGDAMLGTLPLGASRAVEGETLRGAREADVARTIEAIDAIKTARVHLAMPEPSPFVRDQSTPAASVMLTLQTGRTLSQAQVRAIGHLVASSIPGLAADQVSIVDQSGALLSDRDALDDRTLAQQAQIEDRARRALTSLLSPMIGPQNYTSEIHAELDPSESQSTRETYPKDDRALRREEGNKSSGGSGVGPATGIPGALSNQPPPASQISASPGQSLTTGGSAPLEAGKTSSDETYARSFDVGREISVTHQPFGRLRRLSVAVALRDVKGARPRSAQEMASIEALVKGAIGFDQSRGDVVAIASRPFVDAAPADSVAFYDRPWFLTALRQGGAILAALLAFLFVGRPVFKALRSRARTDESESAIADGLLEATRLKKPITLDMIETAPSYEARANLVRDFVRQDSAKAASVVRQLMESNGNG